MFRKDLISAMKIPDSHHVSPEDYYLLADTWKQEWEKGVQVLASPDTIPEPSVRYAASCLERSALRPQLKGFPRFPPVQSHCREVQRSALHPPEEVHPVFGPGSDRTRIRQHQGVGGGHVPLRPGRHGPVLAARAQQ